MNRYGAEIGSAVLAVNIDGAGLKEGETAYSFYGFNDKLSSIVQSSLQKHQGLTSGDPWYSGDHYLFIQHKIPALALTSEHIRKIMKTITHNKDDMFDMVDPVKLAEIAVALEDIVYSLDSYLLDQQLIYFLTQS